MLRKRVLEFTLYQRLLKTSYFGLIDSHKGFCLGYDLELWVNSYKSFEIFSFPVVYKKKTPEYGIQDINNTKSFNLTFEINIIKKSAKYLT